MSNWMGHNGPEIDEPEWLQNPGNWIAISRNLEDHPVVGYGQPVKPATTSRGSYSRAEAWQSLLNMAARKASKVHTWGLVVSLNVGELLGARGYLAQKWNWSDKTVRVFLETLQREGMIEVLDRNFEKIRGQERGQEKGQEDPQGNRRRPNVISIRNYSRYQILTDEICRYIEALRGPREGPREGPTRGQEDHEIGAKRGAERGAEKITTEGPLNHVENQGVGEFRGQESAEARAKRGAERGAKNGDSQGPESNLLTTTVSPRTDSPPYPPQAGAAPELVLEGEPVTRASERRRQAEELIAVYNAAAEHHGWVRCRIMTPAIEQGLLKRVRDIGGRDQFIIALNQIPNDDFLMGRMPGRNGSAPFRLDLSKLLSTRSAMGDVLARLIDAAAAPSGARPKYWWEDPAKVASLSADDWRHLIAKHCVDGVWAVKKVGWPPGHAKCVIPSGIVTALRLTDLWTSDGFART